VLAQIYLGALVAGLRAGYVYNTWPLIDGALVPDPARLFFDAPVWRNFFENTLTVQFDHRMLGYVIFIVRVSARIRSSAHGGESWVVVSAVRACSRVTLQAALGVWTLLLRAPIRSR
jgi:cytochrome c oxidase assembly protein subunit 15